MKAAPTIASSFSGSGGVVAGINAIGKAAGLATASLSTMLGVFGGVTIAVTSIALLVKGINKLVPSYSSASKAAQDAAQEFEDASARVQGTKDELSELNDKISEIQAKGKLSLTDQQELKLLQSQTAELEKQLRINERREQIAATNSARTSKTAANTNDDVSSSVAKILSDNDVSGTGLSVGMDAVSGKTVRGNKKQIASAELNAIDRLKAMQVEKENLLAIDAPHLSEDEFQQRQAEISKIRSQIETLEGDLASVTTDLENFNSGLLLSNGDVVEGFEDEYFEISQILDRYAGIDLTSYDYLLDHFKNIKQIAGDKNWNSEELKTFLETITGQDLSTAKASEIEEIYSRITSKIEGTDHTIAGFFKGGSEKGLQTFLETVEQLDAEWAHFNEDTQQWEVNIDTAKLAQAMGVSESFIDSMMSKLGVYSADLTGVVDDAAERFSMSVDDALTKLHQPSSDVNIAILGNLADAFDIDTPDYSTAVKQMQAYYDVYKRLLGEDGKINLDDEQCQAAAVVMEALLNNVTTLANQDNLVFNVDTSSINEASSEADQLLKAMHDVVVAQTELETDKKLGIDTTEATQKVETAVAAMKSKLDELPKEDQAKLGISIDDTDISDVDALVAKINDIPKEKLVAIGISENLVDKDLAKERDIKTKLKVNDQELKDVTAKTYDVKTKLKITDRSALSGITTTVAAVIKPSSNSNKTQDGLVGFQGNAHVGGKWGTSRDEVALTSELGPEIVVDPKTGRWQTVGDNGAQFTHLPKGAIIFNHKQTEQLLKYGHINSRGKALASGNAYVGKHYSGTIELPTGSQQGANSDGNGSKEQKDAAKSVKKAAEDVSKSTDKIQDWVETVLSNIEKKTEKYLAKAEKKAEAGNYSGAARQYRKAEAAYAKEMSKQKDAESIYMAQANKVLQEAVSKGKISSQTSASIQRKVANGSMELSKVSDSTKEVIDAYKEYYDKAVAAADATMEIYDKYEEVAKKLYQLPLDQADAKTEKLKNEYDILDKKLDLTTSTTKKASLMEQEMTNLRKQHAAVSKAATKAEENYIAAKKKVNGVNDAALKGLSEEMKAKVTAKVADNMVIDVTALTGLTSEGKQAIIDYNSALIAQQDALYQCQISALDTAASMRDLAVEIANLPGAQAEESIENRNKANDLLNMSLPFQETATGKNNILQQNIDDAYADWQDYVSAVRKDTKRLDKLWGSNAVQEYADKHGVQYGEKIDLEATGLDPKSAKYKKLQKYNATIDALANDTYNRDKYAWTYLQTLSDNTGDMFDNVVSQFEKNNKATLDAAESASNDLSDVNAAALKFMEENADMGYTYDEAVQVVLQRAIGSFDTARDAYDTLIELLETWISDNADKLSPEELQEKQDALNQLKEKRDEFGTQTTNATAQSQAYSDQQAQRDVDLAQQQYNEIHQKNAMTVAQGSSISVEDAQAEAEALQNLIDKQDALTSSLKNLRDAQVVGSDAWKDYNSQMEDSMDQSINYRNTLTDWKDEIKNIKFKPITKQLEKLDSEQQKIQDHMTYMQNLGMQPLVSDYSKLINNSRQQVDLLKQQRAELQAQLDAGNLTEAEYERIEQEIRECDAAIRQAQNDQAGWTKAAADTVVGGIQAIGNGISGAFDAVSQVAGIISKIIGQIIQDMADFRKAQLNKIYMAITRIDTKIGTIQHDIELREELGQRVTAADYVQQAVLLADKITKYETDVIPRLESEYRIQRQHRYSHNQDDPLADPDGSKTKAAYEEWQNTVSEAEQLNIELTKLLASGISSALLEPLAEAKEYISDIAGLLNNINDLITDDMVLDADGQFTEQGKQKLAILAGQYRTVQQEVEATKNEIYGLTAVLISGKKVPESFMGDYVAKWTELVEVAESQKSLAIEMVEAMREASEAELSSLQDIIDARREALQAKKDYYDYDKTLRGKTKDIQALQAQIAALEGLTDAESKAKRAKLEADLASAQEDLDATIQQHMFELSSDALDKLGDTLEKAHEEEWDKILNSVDELLKYAADFSQQYSDSQVSDKIEQLLRSYGIITSETSDEDITLLSTLFRKTLSNVNSGDYNAQEFQNAISGYNQAVSELKDKGLLTNVSKIADNTEEMVQTANEMMDSSDDHQTTINTRGNRTTVDLLKEILAGNSIYGESGGKPNLLGQFAIFPQGFAAEAAMWFANSKLESLFGGKEHLAEVANQNAQAAIDTLEKLKDVKIGNWRVFGNYASGTRKSRRNELAWTQEHGKEEWIIRRSDGAILTPLSGDGVLPADITSKLWALAEGKMPQMQMPTLDLPDYNAFETYAPVVNIDNSMTVEGSVDAAVISDLKKFKDEQREDIYQYISDKMYRGYIHAGGKRRL